MLRSVLIVVCLLLTSGVALAQVQKPPKVEVFGGFSYLNIRTYEREHFFNSATGVAFNINKHFALAADVNLPLAGPSDSFRFVTFVPIRPSGPLPIFPPTDFSSSRTSRVTTALFGPRFSLRREKMTLFAHGLAGVARMRERYESGRIGGPRFSYDYVENGPAFGFGGGLDLNIDHRFAVRVIQADYLRTRLNFWGNQVRLQTGVVVRFGKGTK